MARPSLTRRVVVFSSLWTIAALALLGWLLTAQFRAGEERNFQNLQQAQLYALIGAVSLNEDGSLAGLPNLGDASFLEPLSGWYWRVSLISSTDNNDIGSQSLAGNALQRPGLDNVPYDRQFSRRFFVQGPGGEKIRVLESEIDLGSGAIALFQVAGNQTDFERALRDFAARTSLMLLVFGLGMVAINAGIILLGLRPLDRLRKAIIAIRDGHATALEGEFPSELVPMVDEMNSLVDNNRKIVERARTQVGNLAHSLKTPLSVLRNEAEANKSVSGAIVATQTEAMRTQVQHYLDRARIAAQTGSVTFRTDARETIERLANVMRKLHRNLDIDVEMAQGELVFAGEKEDLEEICGNLLENACKWAKGRVAIVVDHGNSDKGRRMLEIFVDDDGPGIAPEHHEKALKRGQRLDETVPGTGLGLSIVADTTEAYGGDVSLEQAPLGGLRVVIRLPSA